MFDVIYHQVNSHTKIVIYQQVYSYTKRVLYHQVCSYTKIVIYHRLYSYTKANTFRWEVGADADVPPRVLPLCLPSMMIKYPYNLLNWSRFTPKRRANHVIPASTQLRKSVPPERSVFFFFIQAGSGRGCRYTCTSTASLSTFDDDSIQIQGYLAHRNTGLPRS
jgi:hypothetical protein